MPATRVCLGPPARTYRGEPTLSPASSTPPSQSLPASQRLYLRRINGRFVLRKSGGSLLGRASAATMRAQSRSRGNRQGPCRLSGVLFGVSPLYLAWLPNCGVSGYPERCLLRGGPAHIPLSVRFFVVRLARGRPAATCLRRRAPGQGACFADDSLPNRRAHSTGCGSACSRAEQPTRRPRFAAALAA